VKGYAEYEIFVEDDLEQLKMATQLVAAVPYIEDVNKKPVRCHELARAVAKVLKLRVHDGTFGAVEHSWIALAHQKRPAHPHYARVLDVYVPGALPQVQIVDTYALLPYRYDPGTERVDIREDVVEWLLKKMFEENPWR
jgi:hypothetical protein